ncbi:preprotein translocase subunit YajC [Apibacter adventoris]|uniref:Sec translocon accessory complex subunit YajC n=1 Tax=Apibacter adventoris TaxID=1679466 RepID=A0A2S8AEC4_9FLAO|nr:preprotein translocase subunit YajC [Apibacter adventoris]PQL93184.1 preprotein translocase subunit YajC [Apibacter adventoris]PQL95883.1 preprotein translocase subunit YajC [Apibacter adventoris]
MLAIVLQAKQGMDWTAFLPLILLFVVFYFFFIRPQTKRQKEEKSFQENINKGTRIVTTSGIHGKVAEIMEDGIIIETMAGKIKFEKSSISRELSIARYPENAPAKK